MVGSGYKNLIQHYRKNNTSGLESTPNSTGNRQPAVLIDGVFLSFRRELFDKIRFDEQLRGFHGYDHNISAQCTIAGYTNYVVFDILLEHFSEGNMNAQYYSNLIEIYKKWESHLPLYPPDVSDEIKANIGNIEIKMLEKLLRRMARIGFTCTLIIQNIQYFAALLDTKKAVKLTKCIRLKIAFEKLIKCKILISVSRSIIN